MNSLISSWCLNSLSKETGHSYDGQSRRRLIYKLIPRQASQASQKAFQAKMKHVHGHVSNWHLAKAMPAASLLCHTPGTQVHLTAPVPGQRAPSCSAPHEGNGMMTTSIIRSSCRVCKTDCHWRCYCRCWVLLHWRCLCFLLAKTSIGPQCGKRARMEQVLQLLWQRECLWCLQPPLSVFTFFLFLLLPVIMYYFLIEYFALCFSKYRCSQQYLLSLAWHKCLRRLTAGSHICCNI